MDFFHGLDTNRYGTFKTNMLNGWASKAISTPDTVKNNNFLAGSWVKTNTMKTESRSAVTFATTLDTTRYYPSKGKKVNKKQQEKTQKETEGKDLFHITCFSCGEK
jgi:hypothetical protein